RRLAFMKVSQPDLPPLGAYRHGHRLPSRSILSAYRPRNSVPVVVVSTSMPVASRPSTRTSLLITFGPSVKTLSPWHLCWPSRLYLHSFPALWKTFRRGPTSI